MPPMTLERYLRRRAGMSSHALTCSLARTMNRQGYPIAIASLFRIKRRQRTTSVGTALAIERATAGVVRAEELPLTRRTRKGLKEMRANLSELRSYLESATS